MGTPDPQTTHGSKNWLLEWKSPFPSSTTIPWDKLIPSYSQTGRNCHFTCSRNSFSNSSRQHSFTEAIQRPKLEAAASGYIVIVANDSKQARGTRPPPANFFFPPKSINKSHKKQGYIH